MSNAMNKHWRCSYTPCSHSLQHHLTTIISFYLRGLGVGGRVGAAVGLNVGWLVGSTVGIDVGPGVGAEAGWREDKGV
jgi:hypothetical protein